MTLEKCHAKSVEIHPLKSTMSELVEQEETTLQTISSPCVEPVIAPPTLSEFEASVQDLSDESMSEERESDCLLFSSTLKQIQKLEFGGYSILFEVPEIDREQVASLLKEGGAVFKLVVVPSENS